MTRFEDFGDDFYTFAKEERRAEERHGKNIRKFSKILEKGLTNGEKSVIIAVVNAASPSGKATDSDSVIT